LEEDEELARVVSSISCCKTIGVSWKEDKLDYTADAADWFDMSLISKMPPPVADKLKKENTFSYQEIVCRMMGKHFRGERYIAYSNSRLSINPPAKIGIEKRVGKTWPNKQWHGYEELKEILESEDHLVTVLQQRDTLRKYMDDIRNCNLIICGDTLAMHIALAYKIPCVAIFNCTSPVEIFDYNILSKIVSPFLFEAFYKKNEIPEVINSVDVDDVYNEVVRILSTSISSVR
jgi:heptosyltransferase-2